MRAKMRVSGVEKHPDDSETLSFSGVAKSDGYPEDGSDENNTFARWTPCAEMTMTVQNPNLYGKFSVNDEFYLDFTKVDNQEVS
jgi:hypothetical protein